MMDPKLIADLEARADEVAKNLPKAAQAKDQAAFQNAAGFHIAALRCAEPRTVAGMVQLPTPAMIANFAFAIELYFKSFLFASNGSPWGHNLQELFRRLSNIDTAEVEKRFEVLSGRNAQALAADLASYAKAFEEWRYIFESSREIRIAVYSMADLARACFLILSERNQGWANESVQQTLSPEPKEPTLGVLSLGGGVMLRTAP